MNKKFLFGFLLSFFLFSFISAQPPVTQVQQFTEGFIIEPSPTIYIKQNTDYTFNFFLYNISNGLNVGGADVSCLFYLAENQGSLIYSGNPTFTDGYYHIVIDGGNFSEAGHYPYGTNCNSSEMGGALVNYFEVTESGGKGIPIEWFVVIILLFAYGIIVFGFTSKEHPPIVMGGIILLVTSLYIFVNGFGAFGAKSLFSQFFAAANLVIGAYVGIKAIYELEF